METVTAPPFGQAGPFSEGSSKPFESGPARDPRYDNQPPLGDRVLLEFEDELELQGIKSRIAELLESAEKCPETIQDQATAGKVGDFCKLARDVERRIEEAREKQNRPLIEARTKLKAKADAVYGPLADAVAKLRSRLNKYIAEQERIAAEQRRKAEEEARRIREEEEKRLAAAAENGVPAAELPPAPIVTPAKVETPIVRGDYGSSVSGRTVWKHERQVPIAKLPKQILENEQVVAAVDKVIASMIRAGTREIKGVRIYPTTEATVR